MFSKNSNLQNHPTINIDDIPVQRVTNFNFLSLTLDEHVSWKLHIKKTALKCARSIGTINKLKHYLPMNVKLLLYNALIHPHLNYCILAWGYKISLRLTKLATKIIRIISP